MAAARAAACPGRADEQIQSLVASLTELHDADGSWGATARDNPAIPAVYTYLAQLLDHDLTSDGASDNMRRDDPDALHNFRTPRLDLDSVYGSGPKVSPTCARSRTRTSCCSAAPAGPTAPPTAPTCRATATRLRYWATRATRYTW